MKAMAAVMAFVAGESMHVQRMCEEVGTSRQTFYKYVARCRAGGLAGFELLSRRPHSYPQATAGDVEDAVVGWRKQLADAGLDHGATTIQWHLGRDVEFTRRCRRWRRCIGSWCAAGCVPTAREATEVVEATLRSASPERVVADRLDGLCDCRSAGPGEDLQHRRRPPPGGLRVTNRDPQATSEEAWATFCVAAQVWGLPAGVLSDSGLCFSGHLRGCEVLFEARLRDAGVRPFTGRPYHPQTTGKVERFQLSGRTSGPMWLAGDTRYRDAQAISLASR